MRLAVSVARSGPVIMADEAGYLMNARVLAGGMPAEMGSSPFYRGGYSLLLAPVLSLDADPVRAYHGALVLNAVLAASLVPLLYLLVTRCLGGSKTAGAWAAIAGAAYPSVTALSQVALSENALFPLTVFWLLSIGCFMRARVRVASIAWVLATGASAAALWTVHGRMLVAVGLTVLLLVALLARRQLELVTGGTGLIALGCTMVAGWLLNDWLVTNSYAGRRYDEAGKAFAALGDVDGVLAVLRNLLGHTWYVVVATLGIALLVLVGDVPHAIARIRHARGESADYLLVVLGATTGGLLVVSSLWLADATRADQLIYGRYVEPVVPVLLAVGVVRLAGAGRLPHAGLLVGIVAAFTAVVAALSANVDVSIAPSRWNVASLPFLTGQLDAPVLVAAGTVAAAALGLILFIRGPAPAALAPLVLVLFVPTTAYIVYLPVLRSERDVYPAGWTSPHPVVNGRHVETVAYDLDHFDHVGVKVYQWFLPHTRMVLFHGDTAASPTPLYFSGRRASYGSARRLWTDPGRDQALWQTTGLR